MLKLLLIFKHQVAYHHTILFISYFFKKISPNRIFYDLIYNEIQNKGRFGDKTKCFLHNNNFLSQIIPFCERENRLKNAILKPKFTHYYYKQQIWTVKWAELKRKIHLTAVFTVKNVVRTGGYTMARRGENIYKRKDGRWEGRSIKAELGLTKQQDTPQYTGKPMPRSRANYRRNVLKLILSI